MKVLGMLEESKKRKMQHHFMKIIASGANVLKAKLHFFSCLLGQISSLSVTALLVVGVQLLFQLHSSLTL